MLVSSELRQSHCKLSVILVDYAATSRRRRRGRGMTRRGAVAPRRRQIGVNASRPGPLARSRLRPRFPRPSPSRDSGCSLSTTLPGPLARKRFHPRGPSPGLAAPSLASRAPRPEAAAPSGSLAWWTHLPALPLLWRGDEEPVVSGARARNPQLRTVRPSGETEFVGLGTISAECAPRGGLGSHVSLLCLHSARWPVRS